MYKNIPKLNEKSPNPTPTFLWLLPYLPRIHFIGKVTVVRQRFFCYFSIVHENNVYYDAVIIIGKYLTSGCVKRYVGRKIIKISNKDDHGFQLITEGRLGLYVHIYRPCSGLTIVPYKFCILQFEVTYSIT